MHTQWTGQTWRLKYLYMCPHATAAVQAGWGRQVDNAVLKPRAVGGVTVCSCLFFNCFISSK